MTKDQLEEEVIRVIKVAISEDDIAEEPAQEIDFNLEARPHSNLGLSSSGMANCITVLEQCLGIDLPSDDNFFVHNRRERTIKEIIDLLYEKITQKEGEEWTLFQKVD